MTLVKASQTMHDSPPTLARYMPQLDGLRALAVFAVVWSHWMPIHSAFAPGPSDSWLVVGGYWVWDHTMRLPWGHFGVQLFFVLSGFLITGILLRAKPQPGESRGPVLKQFFIRRSLRIFPAYYLILAIAWLADFNDTRATIIWHATYSTSIYLWLTKAFSPTSHYWSLSVEEHFYLLWPWVVLWTTPKTLLRVTIFMILATPVFQILMQWIGPQIRPAVLLWLDLPNIGSSLSWLSAETEPTVLMPSAADALGAGALLALVESCEDWKQTFRRIQVLACLPIFVILQVDAFLKGYGLPGAAESIRETAMVVTFSLIVSQAATGFRGPVGWVLAHPLLTGVGKISYGIYLIHNFTPHLMTLFLNQTPIGADRFYALHDGWRFVGLWVLTLALAGTSWFLIERPCLRLKDRWGKV